MPTTTAETGRRFTDGVLQASTVIARGTRVRGDVESDTPVYVQGVLEGDCQTAAHCLVHEGARVLGNISASALVVAGEVEAGLIVAEKVEIRATARVVATIRARVVAINDGAFYEGEIDDLHVPGGPAVVKDRRGRP
jgi:cytoskeletal protein CcmA (bactofilin family)